MQNTPNYNYNLPEYSDSADIAVLNANFSSIDANEYRIEGKLNALGNDIALPYDNTATYSVGDYTIYNNALYRCITAIATAEDFDSTKWTAITIGGELKSHDTRISTLEAGVDLEKSATNSFDDGIDSYFKKVVSSIVPVQAGSGTPSPSNVRAISGFTECTVTDNGKNLANLQPRAESTNANVKSTIYSDNHIVASGTSTGNGDIVINLQVPIKMKANTTYTFSISGECEAQYLYILDSVSGTNKYEVFRSGIASFSWTSDAVINTIIIRSFSGVTVSIDGKMQVEKGSTATDYTPYVAPNTATISFGSAGTVYGGYVDLISGKLVVNSVMIELGTLDWVYDTAWGNSSENRNTFRTVPTLPIKNVAGSEVANIIADRYVTTSANNLYQGADFSVAQNASYIRIRNTDYTDPVAFKTAMSGAQVVYPLATPQEYQLTPAQLRSLVGTNNLTSSTGEVTEVEYIKNKTIAWLLDLIRA